MSEISGTLTGGGRHCPKPSSEYIYIKNHPFQNFFYKLLLFGIYIGQCVGLAYASVLISKPLIFLLLPGMLFIFPISSVTTMGIHFQN
ncbi:hypothetical protein H6798_01985 [Candidatus Nomurabacteria bacterium]|nr:hypothetical protein [Candidatus Nomurabacteria bacterium]